MAQETGDWLGLRGKLCVITGGGRGIGLAIAREFLAVGARVVLLGRDAGVLAEAAAGIDPDGTRAAVRGCDVADTASVVEAARWVEAQAGPVDVLVNNAAVMRPGALDTLDPADWQAQLDVDLTGCLRTAQAFGANMLARGSGALVHISSIAGSNVQPASGAYSAAKAALIMLSHQLAVEWGPRGVRSNVVSPGLVEAPMSAAFYAVPGVRERREAFVPARRIGVPEDSAAAVVFLASARASYINGEEIVVDGGLRRSLMGHIPRPGY